MAYDAAGRSGETTMPDGSKRTVGSFADIPASRLSESIDANGSVTKTASPISLGHSTTDDFTRRRDALFPLVFAMAPLLLMALFTLMIVGSRSFFFVQ